MTITSFGILSCPFLFVRTTSHTVWAVLKLQVVRHFAVLLICCFHLPSALQSNATTPGWIYCLLKLNFFPFLFFLSETRTNYIAQTGLHLNSWDYQKTPPHWVSSSKDVNSMAQCQWGSHDVCILSFCWCSCNWCVFFCFWDRVLLCGPGWPGTHRDLFASAYWD